MYDPTHDPNRCRTCKDKSLFVILPIFALIIILALLNERERDKVRNANRSQIAAKYTELIRLPIPHGTLAILKPNKYGRLAAATVVPDSLAIILYQRFGVNKHGGGGGWYRIPLLKDEPDLLMIERLVRPNEPEWMGLMKELSYQLTSP